ncbi:hypothetical protein E3C22_12855 [Jiella endophytica]|uniref:Uncharacterized protein n=1 Tax=Jiella endophytica TaxID=2558362 RepID=A0A4Y8RJS7_9HYPH|nr:hypothetical protein [Jiella endophytica]TFF23308.1 hypothetical protein E3C22_12855 [Jiella endophytica]
MTKASDDIGEFVIPVIDPTSRLLLAAASSNRDIVVKLQGERLVHSFDLQKEMAKVPSDALASEFMRRMQDRSNPEADKLRELLLGQLTADDLVLLLTACVKIGALSAEEIRSAADLAAGKGR